MFIAKTYTDFLREAEGKQDSFGPFHQIPGSSQHRRTGANNEPSPSNSTLSVVIGLTKAATALEDLDAAAKHLRGLHQMVTLWD
ncbi:hypothetical protein GGS26DRAFT_397719 [Hypomontagnella submonticulosa]|nr:hypothetical protein GGS26DRAFT_397719 [Hypomontagnella submonticulosa]